MTIVSREREVVVLKAVSELINSAVNFEVLSLGVSDPHSEIRFTSTTHQKYFSILLVDLLSRTDSKAVVPNITYLEGLAEICRAPGFAKGDCIGSLAAAVTEFTCWLEQRIEVATWMPSISVQADLPVTRAHLLRIGGNVSKHNFLRLARTAVELQKILELAGTAIDLDGALLALADVYERFHTDVLNYHSSAIAEFLNNIRWGIYEYLQPEFCRSFTPDLDNPPMYRFSVPADVQSALAVECYWELMNEGRSPPYMRRFTVTEWLKKRY